MNKRYYIPPNFDSSKFTLFGLIRVKTLVESLIIVGLFYSITNFFILKFGANEIYRIVNSAVALMALILINILCSRNSLSEIFLKFFRFYKNRRELDFRSIRKRTKLKKKTRRNKPEAYFKEGLNEVIQKDSILNINPKDNECYTQEFISIEEITNSYIKLKDQTYIKIIEINSSNFLNLKKEEQFAIINDFARFLKIGPAYIQFKIISKRSDLTKYINNLKNLTNSRTEKCTKVIDMANEVTEQLCTLAKYTTLEHRYFVIFSYKPVGPKENHIREVINEFTVIKNIVSDKLAKRGVEVIDPQTNVEYLTDPKHYYQELLYQFYNRKSSREESYLQREDKICHDLVSCSDRNNININHLISPRGINIKNPEFLIMDGQYYGFLILTDFPRDGVIPGWLSKYINVGEGFDFDILIQRVNKNEIREKLKKRNIISKTNADQMNKFSLLHSETKKVIQATDSMIKGLEGDSEFYFFMIICTIVANTYEELNSKKRWIKELFESYNFKVYSPKYETEEIFRLTEPLCKKNDLIFENYRRNILTDGIKSFYPFTTASISQLNGLSIGINLDNHSPVILDIFNPISNMFVFGITGYGKTFLCMLIATRLRLMQTQVFVLAPAKGHEYKRICKELDGSFIEIGPGSKDCINILEVRPVKNFDDINQNNIELKEISYLNEKIQDLLVFFDLITDNTLSINSKNLLSPFLTEFYASFGITDDNQTIFKSDGSLKEMPILGDLYKALKDSEESELSSLSIPLKKFVKGNLKYFNHQTNVDLENKFCVIDISNAIDYPETRNLVIYITQNYIWNRIRSDRKKRKAVIFEEIWKLLENKETANSIREMFKTIRGYYGICIGITQNLQDLTKDQYQINDGILNNTLIQIFLHNTSDEALKLKEKFELTDYEYGEITGANKGEALIITPGQHYKTKIVATETEEKLFETDGNKL